MPGFPTILHSEKIFNFRKHNQKCVRPTDNAGVEMNTKRQKTNRVTLKDIALRLGLTSNTISRALKDKDDIALETRKKIQAAALEMGYIKDTVAGSLRSGLTNTIAVVLGDISNPHFGIIVKEIELRARKHRYNTIIFNTDEDPQIERETLISALGRKVDGLILCPTQANTENVTFLKERGIPFVLIGRHFPEMEVDSVVCDDVKGGEEGTKHLIAQGHRRILFLNGPKCISSAAERLAGYKAALTNASIPFDPALVHEVPIVAGNSTRIIDSIVKANIRFSAILAFSDLIAWEVMYALQKHGLENPKDYSIVGFDNTQSKLFFPLPMTSVGSSKTTMARFALDLLFKRLNSDQLLPSQKRVLDTKLIVRSSSLGPVPDIE